ncbi:hypothetical protein HHK36_023344 [Tetracentron sinense]|uniref:glutathione transferase n=1 Tax=Tetracentron sinense TaxID=13715 RepID=A0A834YLA2_TETSI|nr:hypothetical protein HHK36_023344 [Tetracentron sinense]
MGEEVSLIDFWVSPFGMRVRIALAEKDVEYQFIEENMMTKEKSSLLLEMNPVHKKIPVLIHRGRPICESLIIVQYIDEVYACVSDLWKNKDEALQAARKEFLETFKVIEGAIGDKPYLGGETFGFADRSLIPLTSFFHACEMFGNFNIKGFMETTAVGDVRGPSSRPSNPISYAQALARSVVVSCEPSEVSKETRQGSCQVTWRLMRVRSISSLLFTFALVYTNAVYHRMAAAHCSITLSYVESWLRFRILDAYIHYLPMHHLPFEGDVVRIIESDIITGIVMALTDLKTMNLLVKVQDFQGVEDCLAVQEVL